MANISPTGEELGDIALAAQKLWELDENRFVPNVDYVIDLQAGKKYGESQDVAEESLFKDLNREKFFSKPTFRTFYSLLNNYKRSTGRSEEETEHEKEENLAFLNAIMDTPCMKYCHAYLKAKGLVLENDFKSKLYKIWFDFYEREEHNDSSGFEHVFVGEERNGKITGFHNWIQFFVEEFKGKLDYKGYIFPRRESSDSEIPDGNQHIISLSFSWGEEIKPISTCFVGVSPEFEFALYTMMFLASGQSTACELDGFKVAIRCYPINIEGEEKRLGASFPVLLQ